MCNFLKVRLDDIEATANVALRYIEQCAERLELHECLFYVKLLIANFNVCRDMTANVILTKIVKLVHLTSHN